MSGIVKVGNSYVTSAGYAVGQALSESMKINTVDKTAKCGNKNDSLDMLRDLSSRYKETNFMMGYGPFCGQGLNNISISPKVLRSMAESPEKRVEYEALIYDIVNVQKTAPRNVGDSQIIASGFIIDEDGNCGSWAISKSSDNSQTRAKTSNLDRKKKGNWMNELLEKLTEKQNKTREKAEKTAERIKSNVLKRRGDNMKEMWRIDINA